MDVNQFKNLFEDFCNKSQLGGYTKFFNDYLEQAQLEVIDDRIDNERKYSEESRLTKGGAMQYGFEITQKLTDELRNLIVREFITIDDAGTFSPMPSNYRDFSSLRYLGQKSNGALVATNYTTRITVIEDQEFWFYSSGSMYDATKEYPVCTFINNGITFLPINLRSAFLTFIKTPTVPVWGSSLKVIQGDATDPVYNASVAVGNTITVVSPTTGGNATLTVTQVLNGYIEALSVTNQGFGFASSSFVITPSNGSGALGSFTITTRPFYDSTVSVQLEAGPALHMEILKRMLGYCGIKIRDQELYQASMQEVEKQKQ